MFQVGQQVTGKYLGKIAFSGKLVDRRSLTVKTDGAVEYSVELDQPIVVFGTERNHVLMVAKWDGTPSSYTKFTDSLAAA
jgi:hypothetical protein